MRKNYSAFYSIIFALLLLITGFCIHPKRVNNVLAETQVGSEEQLSTTELSLGTLPDGATDWSEVLSLALVTAEDGTNSYTVNGLMETYATISVLDLPAAVNEIPLTAIAANAFQNNSYLSSITIPENILSIGELALASCALLSEINYNATNCETIDVSPNSIIMSSGTSSGGIVLNIGANVKSIPDYGFAYKVYYAFRKINIIEINFAADSVCETIGLRAFSASQITEIVLPNTITSMGGSVFQGCQNLSSVNISKNLTDISSNTFNSCSSLVSIDLPEGITGIGAFAFEGCVNLENINLPGNINYLGQSAFEGCSKITEVVIPDKVTEIQRECFANCTLLDTVVLNNNLEIINVNAFTGCSALKNITIPESLTLLYGGAFHLCTALEVVNYNAIECNIYFDVYPFDSTLGYDGGGFVVNIGENVRIIPNYLFINSGVTEINFGENGNCSNIGSYAFANTYVEDLVVPDTVSTIGDCAFSNVSLLKSVQINGVTSIGNRVFAMCEQLTEINLPTSLQVLGEKAFARTGLTSITIPENVSNIGGSLFAECSSLTEINFNAKQASLSMLHNLVGVLNSDVGLTLNIGGSVIKIPDKFMYDFTKNLIVNFAEDGVLTEIGYSAFNSCIGLSTLSLPEGLKQLGDSVLEDCSNLTSLVIPSTLEKVGVNAFKNTYKLTKIDYNARALADFNSSLQIFYQAGIQSTGITVNIGESVQRIPNFLFFTSVDMYSPYVTAINFLGNSSCNYLGISSFAKLDITSIIIPESVTSLANSVFSGCASLTTVIYNAKSASANGSIFTSCSSINTLTIGPKVTKIPNYLMYNVTSLTTINFPSDGVLSQISNRAFYNTGITSLVLPSTIRNLESSCFASNSQLESVVINEGYEGIYGDGCFNNCTKLKTVSLPSTLTSIGSDFFMSCTSLVEIDIPTSVVYISSKAFYATGLKSVTIHEGVADIEREAFSCCDYLEEINYKAISCNSILLEPGYVFADSGYLGDGITLNIAKSVTVIPQYIFCMSNIVEVVFEQNSQCRDIAYGAFVGCSFSKITIPDSIVNIGAYAFAASYLVNVNLCDNLETIGDGAFYYCPLLEYVEIPASVKRIGDKAFLNEETAGIQIYMMGCVSDGSKQAVTELLSSNVFNGAIVYVPYADMSLYKASNYYTNTLCVAQLLAQSFFVTFDYNTNGVENEHLEMSPLTEITLPQPTREGYLFDGWFLSENLFDEELVTSTKEFVKECTLFARYTYLGNWNEMYQYITIESQIYISGLVENMAVGVVDFVIPAQDGSGNSIYGINVHAFSASVMHSLEFEEGCSITVIRQEAFVNSKNLKSVSFENAMGLVNIQHGAFKGAKIEGVISLPVNLQLLGNCAFEGNSITEFNINNDYLIASNGIVYSKDMTTLTLAPNILNENVVIDERTTTINDYAFVGSKGLLSISGTAVTNVNDGAFARSSIEYFDFPELVSIGVSAFDSSNLKTIKIAKNVQNIENNAFVNIDNLTDIVIEGKLDVSRLAIPTITDSFASNESNIVVYVDKLDVDAYKSSDWARFTIVGLDSGDVWVVTVDLDGGYGYSENYYIVNGKTLDLSVNPTRIGYVFVTWKRVVGEELVDFGDDMPITENITIKAIWDTIVYEIVYYIDGGIIDGNNDTYTQTFTIMDFGDDLSTVIAVQTPTKDGYEFIGWYTNAEFDSAKVKNIAYNALTYNQILAVDDILLYAKWDIIKYTMKFEDVESYSITLDNNTLNPIPWSDDFGFVLVLAEGYSQNTSENILVQLYSEDGLTLIRTLEPIASRTISLHYIIENVQSSYFIKVSGLVINTYHVYFNSSLNDVENLPSTIKIEHGKSISESISEPTKMGYTFKSWNQRIIENEVEKIDANPFNFNSLIYSDITLVANFNIIEYVITLYLNGATVNDREVESIKINYSVEDTIILPLEGNATYNIKKLGYTITGWYSEFELDENEYIINSQSLTTAVLAGSSGDREYVLGFNKNNYNIIYYFNDGTYSDDYVTTFDVHDSFELIVPVKVGNTFNGWYLDEEMTNNKLTRVEEGTTRDLTLYAKWEENTYDIVYHLNGSSYNEVFINGVMVNYLINSHTVSYTYDSENDYSLDATTRRNGYTFDGWYDNPDFEGNKILSLPAGSIVSNKDFYAKWISNVYTINFDYTPLYTPDAFDVTIMNISTIDLENSNGSIAITPNPNVNGYTFKGWLKDGEKITNITFNNIDNMTLVANFVINKYNITLLGDNVQGNVALYDNDNMINNVDYGSNLEFEVKILNPIYSQSISTIVVSYSYEEDGEYVVVNKEGETYSIDNVTSDIYIKIEGITINSFSVEFITNGGSEVTKITDIKYGDKIAEPTEPTRSGYEFGGWYTTSTLVTEFDFDSQITNDLHLYAKWIMCEYIATLKNNVDSNSIEIAFNVENASSISLLGKNFAFVGYEFVGFYLMTVGEDDYVFNNDDLIENLSGIYDNVVIIAKFEVITYNIYYGIDAGINNPNNPTTFNVNTETITLLPATKTNYIFVAWEDAESGESVTAISKGTTKDIYLVATFRLISADYVTIRYFANGEFYSEVAVKIGDSINSTPSAQVQPKQINGYEFKGYYTDGNYTTVFDMDSAINSNINLYGKYDKISYTITYMSNVSSFENNVSNKEQVSIDDDFNLEDASKLGYQFEGWYCNVVVDGNNYDFANATKITRIINQTEDLVLYAKFTIIKYSITYSLDGGELQNSNPYYYTVETEISRFNSPSKTGYTFLYWKNNETGERIDSITRGTTGNLILVAQYRVVSDYVVITYYIDGNKYLFDSVELGTTINDVLEPTKDYYEFEGWYSDIGFTNKVSSSTIVTANMSLYAKFMPINFHITYTFKDDHGNVLLSVNNDNDNIFNIEKLIQFDIPYLPGYTFKLFSLDDDPITSTFGIFEDINVIGVFKLTQYNISYVLNGGEAENPHSYTIKDGVITLNDAHKDGYKFVGWFDGETNNQVLQIDTSTMKDYTVYAKFDDRIVASNSLVTILAILLPVLTLVCVGVLYGMSVKRKKLQLKKKEELTSNQNRDPYFKLDNTSSNNSNQSSNNGIFIIPNNNKTSIDQNKSKNIKHDVKDNDE